MKLRPQHVTDLKIGPTPSGGTLKSEDRQRGYKGGIDVNTIILRVLVSDDSQHTVSNLGNVSATQ